MRLAIAGGGTGGHIYPGIAVAEEIRRRGGEVFFFGTAAGMESRIVPQAGYPFHAVAAGSMKRQEPLQNFRSVCVNAKGIFDAARILRRARPDVLLGTGGYVSFPAAVAAWASGIPVAVHEQNAVRGMANRYLSRLASVVMTSWVQTDGLDPSACKSGPRDRAQLREQVEPREQAQPVRFVGLPTRRDFLNLSRDQARTALKISSEERVLLVFGGSRGSTSINAAVMKMLPRLSDVTVIWATGTENYSKIAENVKKASPSSVHVRISPYIENMPVVLRAADLALTRSGAMTLAELGICGIPAVLVPYPFATEDHQTANARAFTQAGAAEMICDAELENRLYDVVSSLLADPERLKDMAARALSLGHPDAAEKIVDILEELVK